VEGILVVLDRPMPAGHGLNRSLIAAELTDVDVQYMCVRRSKSISRREDPKKTNFL